MSTAPIAAVVLSCRRSWPHVRPVRRPARPDRGIGFELGGERRQPVGGRRQLPGIQVVYTPDGDAQGRQDFANKTSDFAVTSDGYQGIDPVTGVDRHVDRVGPTPTCRSPPAGRRSPIRSSIDGQQVENLRLSGETLAKIFTNQITNWDDPEITAGQQRPRTAVAAHHAGGAVGGIGRHRAADRATSPPSSRASGRPSPARAARPSTSPVRGTRSPRTARTAAMNYVASSSANGSISYVEYSFALSVNYPGGQGAQQRRATTRCPPSTTWPCRWRPPRSTWIPTSPDYLLQNLTNVYTDPDPRTYPLSSYVYMIEPTGSPPSRRRR